MGPKARACFGGVFHRSAVRHIHRHGQGAAAQAFDLVDDGIALRPCFSR